MMNRDVEVAVQTIPYDKDSPSIEKKQLELWKKHPAEGGGGVVALQTKGRALKVHAGDTPHLVSLGGDRFSTAVTLHPIPNGHVKLGSGNGSDIPIFGTGVEDLHCWIENKEGVVTLYPYPGVENILIDGLKVSQPTRLTQGCMLCVGRSNFLRFNHPQEARYMRSIMPNTRVSIMPNVFYPSSIGDGINGSETANSSKEDFLTTTSIWRDITNESYSFSKHISPKVFPPGSSTLNSPASVVLGYKYSNHLSLAQIESSGRSEAASGVINKTGCNTSNICKEIVSINGIVNDCKIDDTHYRNNNSSFVTNSNYDIVSSSSESVYQRQQRLAIPSPSFDRNPSYFSSSGNSPPAIDNAGDISPVSLSSPRSISGDSSTIIARRFSPIEGNLSSSNSLSSPSSFTELNNNSYISDCGVKKEENLVKLRQVHNNRLLEQEKERLERLRLEEILTLCAEYEKQAQFDRSKSQLRIKTNGSLPRDKKHCSPLPGCKTPDSPHNGLVVFTFDKCENSNKISKNDNQYGSPRDVFYPSSPRSRIKTVASPKDHPKDQQQPGLEIFENKLAVLNNSEILNVCTSRTNMCKDRRGKVNVGTNEETTNDKKNNGEQDYPIPFKETVESSPDVVTVTNNDSFIDTRDKISSVKEMNAKNKYKFFGICPEEVDKTGNSRGDSLPFIPFATIDGGNKLSRSYHHHPRDDQGSNNFTVQSRTADSTMYMSLTEVTDKNNNNRNNNIRNGYDGKKKSNNNSGTGNGFSTINRISELPNGAAASDDAADSDIEKLNGLVLELNEIVKETELSLSVHHKQQHSNNTDSGSIGFHSDDTTTDRSSINGRQSSADDCSSNSDTTNDSGCCSVNNNNNTNNNVNNGNVNNSCGSSKFISALDNEQSSRLTSDNDSRFILPLEQINTVLRRQCFSMKKNELKKLHNEQSSLLQAINNVKLKLIEIQQQKDDIMKELEIEKALVEAELKVENGKLIKEEESLIGVQMKIQDCESSIEICSKNQMERQAYNTEIVSQRKAVINKLEQSLANDSLDEEARKTIQENTRLQRESLEDEVKKFEDFEFKLLEEEATLLSKREELQLESQKANSRIEFVRSKVSDLFSQKERLLQNASDEIKNLELQVRNQTTSLQQNHKRLQEISLQLKSTTRSLSEISECDSESSEDITASSKTQSQEDLDRISRVTLDAPIMETGSTNSLGRRTIASLQEIERNRQLHLAHQGSQVIEEERKRVLALKERVQNEVRVKWQQQKQRENCNSFNSDNSSLTSFERVTESPSVDECKKSFENESIADSINVSENRSFDSMTITNSSREENERTPSRPRHSSNASLQCTEPNPDSIARNKSSTSNSNHNPRPESRHSVLKRGSFDLRRHIESAGHLLERCPQVTVDSTSCRGYLHKMTTKFRTWNKRWFVFDRTKCSFVYYADKSEKKMRAGTYFQGLIDLYIDKANVGKSPHSNCTFVVKSSERAYYLMAPSVEVMRIWFDVIATEVDVYHDA